MMRFGTSELMRIWTLRWLGHQRDMGSMGCGECLLHVGQARVFGTRMWQAKHWPPKSSTSKFPELGISLQGRRGFADVIGDLEMGIASWILPVSPLQPQGSSSRKGTMAGQSPTEGCTVRKTWPDRADIGDGRDPQAKDQGRPEKIKKARKQVPPTAWTHVGLSPGDPFGSLVSRAVGRYILLF